MRVMHRIGLVVVSLLLVACNNGGATLTVDGGGDSARSDGGDGGPPDVGTEVAGGEDTDGEEDLLDLRFDLPDEAVGPQCQPGEGCFLDPCETSEDCLSGWCVGHMGEAVCTIECQTECPPGWECQQVPGSIPDVVWICVSPFANLCQPCATSADCQGAAGVDDACLDYGEEGSFCGGACLSDEECPWGFSCGEALTVDGVSLTQCVADAGVCPCTQHSIDLGLSTPCEKSNEFGTCEGSRVCTEDGLSDCDAAEPAQESCNGLDDDCDGETDEPTLVEGKYVELCDDGNPCTEDWCDAAQGCAHSNSEKECQDGNPCTVADHCEAGVCVGDAVECDDKNPCTADVCTEKGGCDYPPIPGECDDGEVCTLGDHCVDGECVGTEVECDCQVDGDCGALEHGNLCNGTLFCNTAKVPFQCQVKPGTEVSCPGPEGPDAPCLEASCNPATGACSLVPVGDGKPCEEGDLCTLADSCLEGACTGGKAANCNDGNVCTDDSCDPDVGCVHTPNAAPCTDGNVCTVADLCAGGECVAGEALDCDDGDLCNGAESCDPVAGCMAGTPLVCGDGNVCNGVESCDPAVGCVAGKALVCDDGNACDGVESCDPVVGCVAGEPLVCVDEDLCNGLETCDPAVGCVAGKALVCDDGNPCDGVESCDPALGCVAGEPLVCDDGDSCNGLETCVPASGCVAGKALVCDDGNPCTDDGCEAEGGCTHVANVAACDDGNPCTTGDVCAAGACKPTGTLSCDDGNMCTDDSCSPVDGCVHKTNTKVCTDNDACTLGDHCVDGGCVGTEVVCDDLNPCTDDSCDPQKGCVHEANELPCNDGNACTEGDLCGGGWCQPGAILDCDDDNPCTTDLCSLEQGCVHLDNASPCNDGDVCTVGDLCVAGACEPGEALDCDDGNVCTDDSCNPATGCVHEDNVLECDDGTACTDGDLCANGACVPGPVLDCDDGNSCTEDSCDAVEGCQHAVLEDGTPCDDDGNDCTTDECSAGVCTHDGEGWTGYGGHCYRYFTDKKNWFDARAACQALGGDLASMANAAENDFVHSIVIPKETAPWIGFNDQGSEGSWQWSDGSAVTFTNWAGGEPNNSGNEDCGHLYVYANNPQDKRWNDAQCGSGYDYICEKP
jgi:hypothetical protein